jgi:hypothetical protein
VRELSRRICLPRSIVHRHRHLTQLFRFIVRHFRWVPHFLTDEQKQIRVKMAIELLQALSVQSKARASGTILSPWTSRGFICSVSMIRCGRLPEKLLSIGSGTRFNHRSLCWRSCGIPSGSMFHVPCSESPPEGVQIQCTILLYYTNDILVPISDWRWQTEGTRPNKLWVHSDNARPHTAKMSRDYIGLNRMKQASHPPIRKIWHPQTFSLLATSKES